jgi:CRISPR/Cas system CSM-associated protein Csm3 (group 7 of RAMP superfamily)
MKSYKLRLELLSDTTFGRGDGVAGLVDAEVQHDEVGLPYLGGRTLKGLLGAECADIVHALRLARPDQASRWQTVAERLFGRSGAALDGEAILRVGAARLPDDLRLALLADVRSGRLTPTDILETVTALRRQTALDEWGTPQENTLRTMRVVLRKTVFWAPLDFLVEAQEDDLALLAAGVKAFRRAGTGRNRGRGRLYAELLDTAGQPVTDQLFRSFRKAVTP